MVEDLRTTDVHKGVAILLASLLTLPSALPVMAAPGDRESDALPYQYIYLTDFARLRHEAQRGNPAAQFQLGLMHYDPPDNSGIGQSYRRAFMLFFEAGLRGHTTAQHNVGAMYWNGDHVSQDLVEGYAWFQLAALAGDPAGQRKLKRHVADLSAEQLKAAKARVPQLQAMLEQAKKRRVFDPRDYGIR